MPAPTYAPGPIPGEQLSSFTAHLKSSKRIVALLGAGLSASSGLPTFRGAGGLWRTHDATSLATPEAFQANPSLVWQFYSYRRHMALSVRPNKAHYALAQLAQRMPGFLTLSQNVDGLSQRAGHTPEQLLLLHGSLFDVRCTGFYCDFKGVDYSDPIVPALAIPTDQDPTTKEALTHRELDISDAGVPLAGVPLHALPRCSKCKQNLLRPGVVWFGESLPTKVLGAVDDFFETPEKVDLVIVIGTSARVYPAAAYVDIARKAGAKVAVVNMDRGDLPASGLREGDWFFQGDAAEIVPEMLKGVIGETVVLEGK